jgi:hypothetical protein
MSKLLFEDTFQMVNVKNLFNNKLETDELADSEEATAGTPEDAEQPKGTEGTEGTEEVAKDEKVTDWGDLLKRSLEKNAKLSPDAQKSEAEIREAFWNKFYKAHWKDDVIKKLKNISLISQDIEKLGFNKLLNPIFAFLLVPRVQEFLKADLLNAETYKAIHNAVAHKYIADSELVQANNYNIIYCKNLYKKPSRDMEEYIRLQSFILKPAASAYNDKTLSRNIRMFLKEGSTSVQDENAILLDLDDIASTIKETTGQDTSKASEGGSKSGGYDFAKVVNELKSIAHIIAALQFIIMSTNSDAAKAALSKTPSVSSDALVKVTPDVAKYLSSAGINLTADNAKSFVELLVDRLKKVQ